MKYTKEQLEGMSDLQINRAIDLSKGLKLDAGVKENQDSGFCATNYKDDSVTIDECGGLVFANYCNNWADMGALAFASKINFNHYEDDEGEYCSCSKGENVDGSAINMYDHENPLRAAAIVYLLMQEGE